MTTIYLGAMSGDEFEAYRRDLRLSGALKTTFERIDHERAELSKLIAHRLKAKR